MLGSDILVDALPYIDQGYDDPGVREAVSNPPHSYTTKWISTYFNLKVAFLLFF